MVQPVQHWESHTPPAMPRDCSCLSGYWSDSCLSRRGFEGICFILALTFTHLLIQGPPHNLPELCICRVASQVNVPEMMKRWLTSRGYALSLWRQENTLWGKGSQEILIKKIAKTRRNFLSQERLQALLYQDKELKLARSVITKAASLRTAKPDFQSRQVPIHLTCLCAGCTPANLSMDGPSQALEEQHLVHVSVWALSPVSLAQSHLWSGTTVIPHPPSRLHINPSLSRALCTPQTVIYQHCRSLISF